MQNNSQVCREENEGGVREGVGDICVCLFVCVVSVCVYKVISCVFGRSHSSHKKSNTLFRRQNFVCAV